MITHVCTIETITLMIQAHLLPPGSSHCERSHFPGNDSSHHRLVYDVHTESQVYFTWRTVASLSFCMNILLCCNRYLFSISFAGKVSLGGLYNVFAHY